MQDGFIPPVPLGTGALSHSEGRVPRLKAVYLPGLVPRPIEDTRPSYSQDPKALKPHPGEEGAADRKELIGTSFAPARATRGLRLSLRQQ